MSSPESVLVALGSNLGDRARNVRRAIHQLQSIMTVVRVAKFHETAAVDSPPNAPDFVNTVVAGFTSRDPEAFLEALHAIEQRLGRIRSVRNAPRTIDLDLVLHSANLRRSRDLTLPHPRYREREFVMKPLRELRLSWVDPATGARLT